jgi:hypothetical protein
MQLLVKMFQIFKTWPPNWRAAVTTGINFELHNKRRLHWAPESLLISQRTMFCAFSVLASFVLNVHEFDILEVYIFYLSYDVITFSWSSSVRLSKYLRLSWATAGRDTFAQWQVHLTHASDKTLKQIRKTGFISRYLRYVQCLSGKTGSNLN